MTTAAATEETHAGRGLQLVGKSALPGFTLTPKNLAEAMELAKLMADSELVPKDFRGKPGNVLIAVQMGSEVGLGPMASVQNIAVINGKPGIYGDAGKALLLAVGCRIEESDVEEIRKTGIARCRITRPNGAVTERTFSMDDAKTAKLWGKEGPWTNSPYRQMAWRAFWFAARDGAADILKGLGGSEELVDIEREPRNITPVQMPQSRSGAPVEASAGKPERVVERVPGSDGTKTVFEINGRPYETNGMTKDQMLESFDLVRDVDAKLGKNTAARVLLRDFQPVESRNDLTEDQAKRYIETLRGLL